MTERTVDEVWAEIEGPQPGEIADPSHGVPDDTHVPPYPDDELTDEPTRINEEHGVFEDTVEGEEGDVHGED
jgi:hypothetical protein